MRILVTNETRILPTRYNYVIVIGEFAIMRRRQFLAAGAAASGSVGLAGCNGIVKSSQGLGRLLQSGSLPNAVEESWLGRQRNPRNDRFVATSTSLSGSLQQYWERAPNDAGTFMRETARIRDGVLYVTAREDELSGATYAINARDGSIKWSTDATADAILLPEGDEMYIVRSINVDESELVEILRFDKETGERLGGAWQRAFETTLDQCAVSGDVVVASRTGGLAIHVVSVSEGEHLYATGSSAGYAMDSGSLYVVATVDGGLRSLDLETGEVEWNALDGWDGPNDPEFGRPIVRSGTVFVREMNRDEVLVLDENGTLTERYELPTGIDATPIVTPGSIYAPHRDEETNMNRPGKLTKYRRTEDGEVTKEWTYEKYVPSMYCAFENGIVASNQGYVNTEGNTFFGMPTPGFYDGDEWGRFYDPTVAQQVDVGPVLSNALFTFGDSVRAYASA